MRCRVCGSTMISTVTDLPFKLGPTTIVILKRLPVEQCGSCGEYSLTDTVMARIDQVLEKVAPEAELEIIRYAA